jgi:hypothetical protein
MRKPNFLAADRTDRSHYRHRRHRRTAATAATGSWTVTAYCLGINPIHVATTRTGKFLMVAGSGYNRQNFALTRGAADGRPQLPAPQVDGQEAWR